jgi:hypothetical protein
VEATKDTHTRKLILRELTACINGLLWILIPAVQKEEPLHQEFSKEIYKINNCAYLRTFLASVVKE